MGDHRGHAGGALLASAFVCWAAAVAGAAAKSFKWTSAGAIVLFALGFLCLVASLWAFGRLSAILGPSLKAGKRVASAVINWSPVVWRGFPSSRTAPWASGTLEVVRVASQSRAVEVCELRASGRLLGERLPLSRPRAPQREPRRIGLWRVDKDGLRIVAATYQLLVRPQYVGVWPGEERYGDDVQQFIGAIVDERPIQPGEDWVALKLGDNDKANVRRVMVARADGTLQEFALFDPERRAEGSWEAGVDELRITVNDYHLTASGWTRGRVWGVERSTEKQQEQNFVVVRVASEAPLRP